PEDQMRPRQVRRGEQIYEMAVRQAEPVREAKAAPPTDRLGIAIPPERRPVFAAAADFALAKELFCQLAEIPDRLAQQPRGAAYRQQLKASDKSKVRSWAVCHAFAAQTRVLPRQTEVGRESRPPGQVSFESALLRGGLSELETAEPFCAYCPLCEVAIPGSS